MPRSLIAICLCLMMLPGSAMAPCAGLVRWDQKSHRVAAPLGIILLSALSLPD